MAEWTEADQQALDALTEKYELYKEGQDTVDVVAKLRNLADALEAGNKTLMEYEILSRWNNDVGQFRVVKLFIR